MVGCDVGVATVLVPEQRAFGIGGSVRLMSGQQIAVYDGHGAWAQRKSPRLEELGVSNVDGVVGLTNVAEVKAHDLCHAKPGTVSQNKHGVQRQWPQRSLG